MVDNLAIACKNPEAGPSPSSPALVTKEEVPIVAAYSIYRDADYLRSSLDSICNYVDAIALLDGRLLDSPELPDDGSDRIVSETASRFDPRFVKGGQKFAIFRTKPIPEIEKKDLAFTVVKPGCFAFILDGEEIAVGDVKAGLDYVREHAEESDVFFVRLSTGAWEPRIIRVKPGLHFDGQNSRNQILDSDDEPLIHNLPSELSLVPYFQIHNMKKEVTA